MKNVLGGQGCSIAIQSADGSWTTRQGTCQRELRITSIEPSLFDLAMEVLGPKMYCETGLGNIKLTSNGGHSRC